MTIRLSYWLCVLPPFIGVAIGVIEDLAKGRTHNLVNLTFWPPIVIGILAMGALLWIVPWGKLTKESVSGLDTICRYRTIKWTEITSYKVQRIPGLTYFRLYSANSRFALWFYVPSHLRAKITQFIVSHAPSSLVARELTASGSN